MCFDFITKCNVVVVYCFEMNGGMRAFNVRTTKRLNVKFQFCFGLKTWENNDVDEKDDKKGT